MNAAEGIIDDLNTADIDFVRGALTPLENYLEQAIRLGTRVYEAIDIYKKTGVGPEIDFENFASPEGNVNIKENIRPSNVQNASEKTRRTRRNAFKEASLNITAQSKLSFSTKLRSYRNTRGNGNIKVEWLSPPKCENVCVKSEPENMPAPLRPAPKNRTRKNKVTIEIKKALDRDSDVIVQDLQVSVISLVDSDNEDSKPQGAPATKLSCDEHQNQTSSSVYEDATSQLHINAADVTFISKPANADKPSIDKNATVVIENPKYLEPPKTIDDLMTDDDSEDENKNEGALGELIKASLTNSKQGFKPSEESTVKKKVQTFEKLAETSAIPVRSLRTRPNNQETSTKSVKEEGKILTPAHLKYVPKAKSASVKVNKVLPENSPIPLPKSASAMKASQMEYRQREQKRREKEEDALKKRDALMQAHVESKKKKREEKELKVQQQREALEKEKQKALEMQLLKEEKYKQFLAEQEEHKLKQKQELEKKRFMAKVKAQEAKKLEVERKLEEERKMVENAKKVTRKGNMAKSSVNQKPIYMIIRAPLLPTDDCYDSDDERSAITAVKEPEWAKQYVLKRSQLRMIAIGERIKNSFFCRQVQTPDLQEIFEVIEPKKLKRTSSAVWQKAPRFTMMPMVEEHDETAEFSE